LTTTHLSEADQLAESRASIRQMLAAADLADADHAKRLLEIRQAPRGLRLQEYATFAAVFGAGSAYTAALLALLAYIQRGHL
jgi:hypothetical protein